MKCPKCGYVSFDHHQVCPKCSRDVLAEQRRLNLPDYQPDPPFFLGALTGEGPPAREASPPIQDTAAAIDFNRDLPSKTEDEADLSSAPEMSPPKSLAGISAAPVKAPEEGMELDLDELSLDLDEGDGSEDPGSFQFEPQSDERDSISLDFNELSADEERPSNGGSAPSDRGKIDPTLALGGGMELKENKMGFDTAEMLTLELDRKLDATSAALAEDELDDFEFDIDLEDLKEVKD